MRGKRPGASACRVKETYGSLELSGIFCIVNPRIDSSVIQDAKRSVMSCPVKERGAQGTREGADDMNEPEMGMTMRRDKSRD